MDSDSFNKSELFDLQTQAFEEQGFYQAANQTQQHSQRKLTQHNGEQSQQIVQDRDQHGAGYHQQGELGQDQSFGSDQCDNGVGQSSFSIFDSIHEDEHAQDRAQLAAFNEQNEEYTRFLIQAKAQDMQRQEGSQFTYQEKVFEEQLISESCVYRDPELWQDGVDFRIGGEDLTCREFVFQNGKLTYPQYEAFIDLIAQYSGYFKYMVIETPYNEFSHTTSLYGYILWNFSRSVPEVQGLFQGVQCVPDVRGVLRHFLESTVSAEAVSVPVFQLQVKAQFRPDYISSSRKECYRINDDAQNFEQKFIENYQLRWSQLDQVRGTLPCEQTYCQQLTQQYQIANYQQVNPMICFTDFLSNKKYRDYTFVVDLPFQAQTVLLYDKIMSIKELAYAIYDCYQNMKTNKYEIVGFLQYENDMPCSSVYDYFHGFNFFATDKTPLDNYNQVTQRYHRTQQKNTVCEFMQVNRPFKTVVDTFTSIPVDYHVVFNQFQVLKGFDGYDQVRPNFNRVGHEQYRQRCDATCQYYQFNEWNDSLVDSMVCEPNVDIGGQFTIFAFYKRIQNDVDDLWLQEGIREVDPHYALFERRYNSTKEQWYIVGFMELEGEKDFTYYQYYCGTECYPTLQNVMEQYIYHTQDFRNTGDYSLIYEYNPEYRPTRRFQGMYFRFDVDVILMEQHYFMVAQINTIRMLKNSCVDRFDELYQVFLNCIVVSRGDEDQKVDNDVRQFGEIFKGDVPQNGAQLNHFRVDRKVVAYTLYDHGLIGLVSEHWLRGALESEVGRAQEKIQQNMRRPTKKFTDFLK